MKWKGLIAVTLLLITGGIYFLYIANLSTGLVSTQRGGFIHKAVVAMLDFRLKAKFPPGTPITTVVEELQKNNFGVSTQSGVQDDDPSIFTQPVGYASYMGVARQGIYQCTIYGVKWKSADRVHVDSIESNGGACLPINPSGVAKD